MRGDVFSVIIARRGTSELGGSKAKRIWDGTQLFVFEVTSIISESLAVVLQPSKQPRHPYCFDSNSLLSFFCVSSELRGRTISTLQLRRILSHQRQTFQDGRNTTRDNENCYRQRHLERRNSHGLGMNQMRTGKEAKGLSESTT